MEGKAGVAESAEAKRDRRRMAKLEQGDFARRMRILTPRPLVEVVLTEAHAQTLRKQMRVGVLLPGGESVLRIEDNLRAGVKVEFHIQLPGRTARGMEAWGWGGDLAGALRVAWAQLDRKRRRAYEAHEDAVAAMAKMTARERLDARGLQAEAGAQLAVYGCYERYFDALVCYARRGT